MFVFSESFIIVTPLVFYFLWIGAQLPQEQFISYGRFLLFLLMLDLSHCLNRPLDVVFSFLKQSSITPMREEHTNLKNTSR